MVNKGNGLMIAHSWLRGGDPASLAAGAGRWASLGETPEWKDEELALYSVSNRQPLSGGGRTLEGCVTGGLLWQ